jgi:hypothetical protein
MSDIEFVLKNTVETAIAVIAEKKAAIAACERQVNELAEINKELVRVLTLDRDYWQIVDSHTGPGMDGYNRADEWLKSQGWDGNMAIEEFFEWEIAKAIAKAEQ